ncbi:MAG: glycerophosphodiester phosphodiesterase family protein, partial [Oscillospiraceae bacterium]
MIWLLYCAAALAATALLYLFLMMPARATREQRAIFERRTYAHRGLYDNEKGVPENSLAAFEAAMRAGYGCELDVQFTSDKKLIVYHDNDFKRACGIDKKVWEMTFAEVRELRLFATDEKVPTFEEVLEVVGGKEPLIVEVKAERLNKKWYDEVCEDTMKLLRGYKGEYCVESFHPLAVRWFKKNAPEVVRGQLINGRKSSPSLNAAIGFFAENLCMDVLGRPQFIAYKEQDRNFALRLAQKLGAFTVMWTVRSMERQKQLEKKENAII